MLALQAGENTKSLGVALEAAVVAHEFIQGVLTGMAKGRMPQVMRQAYGFDQVGVRA